MNEKKILLRNVASGVFFIGGILLVFGMIFMIGNDKGFAESKFKIIVLFRDVGGLIEGAPVRLAGVTVGTVSNISFLDEKIDGRSVRVEISLYDRYRKQLHGEVAFSIKTEGILGEKLVEIQSGEGGPPADFSLPAIGEDPMNVQDLAQAFADAAQSFTRTSEDFSKVNIQDLSQVLGETAESLTETSRGINTILTELHHISIKSKRLLDRLEQRIIDGNLFKVF